jgi:hypothetical protein
MWDNRVGKKNPKSPDYKCKDKECGHAIWLTDAQKATQSMAPDKKERSIIIQAMLKSVIENYPSKQVWEPQDMAELESRAKMALQVYKKIYQPPAQEAPPEMAPPPEPQHDPNDPESLPF